MCNPWMWHLGRPPPGTALGRGCGYFGILLHWLTSIDRVEAASVALLFEQLGMGAGSHKIYQVSQQLIDQQKVAADMAFAIISPLAF